LHGFDDAPVWGWAVAGSALEGYKQWL
jgi:hypothetical protein